MDLDAFVGAHRGEWQRLHRLAGRSKRRLTAAEVDELVTLYQRTATHLSLVRSRSPDPAVVAWLSRLVLQARGALTPSAGFTWAGVRRFLLVSFPGEVYRARRWWLAVTTGFLVLAGIRMALVATDPERYASPAAMAFYAEQAFADYYQNDLPQNFAFLVWTNNAFLAAVCLAAGIAILPVVLWLWYVADSIGLAGGVMIASGRTDLFFGLILIHGLLELTAIFIAAGVGLRIGGAWIAPGRYLTRGQAVAERARSGMVVALGLGLVLLVSGLVEAYLTPSALPIPVKLGFGAVLWVGLLGYLFGFGARADRQRQSADVDPFDRPAAAPTEATPALDFSGRIE